MTAVAQQVPGVSFKTSGPGQTEFEMRGLTSTGGESPTVGFYLDDAVLTPAAMAQNGKTVIDPSLFDLNRVEVLRGPQGTLYGAGSMGGTIKLVTNQPDPKAFAANVEVIGSGHDQRRRLQSHRERDVEHPADAGCGGVAFGRHGQIHRWMDRPESVESLSGRGQRQHGARRCCRRRPWRRIAPLEHGALAGGAGGVADSAQRSP